LVVNLVDHIIRDAKLTNRVVGEMASMHPVRVGQIRNGRVVPPRSSVELVRLAAALEYEGDPADLIEPVEEPVSAQA
jgi:hypothetical protein